MSEVLDTFRQQNPAYRPHSVNALQYDDRPLAIRW